jgi:hypothetical protein
MSIDSPPGSPSPGIFAKASPPLSPVQPPPHYGASQWQAQQNALAFELHGMTPIQWQASRPGPVQQEISSGEEDTVELQDGIWDQLKQVLVKSGLVDEKLAMQQGEEEMLLEQLMASIDIQPSVLVKRALLKKLEDEVEAQRLRLPLIKRLKGESMSWEYQALEDFRLAMDKKKLPQAQQSEVLEVPMPGRRGRLSVAASEQDAAVDEMMELEKIAGEIIDYLLEQDLPNVKMAQQTSEPWKILRGALGDSRMGTMKVYWRVWRSFLTWLLAKRQMSWPSTHLLVVEYLHEAVNEPCARSHPQSLIQALAWMERAGGVKPADQLSREPLLMKTVEFIIGKLSQGIDPAKQAPRLPILILAALESYVCHKKAPIYLRYRAFTILFKVWGTLRQDDIQHLSPGRLRMVSDSVVGELMRTKTTGATKRVKEVPLVIATGASITGMPWLQVGMKLIADYKLFDKKYLLPVKGQPFGTRMAKYAAASAASKAVLEGLQRPRAWTRSSTASSSLPMILWDFTANEMPLVPPELIDFWTEHSPRACVPSWTGLLGVEKSIRDLLGRWSPTGSEDYTRTYRLMVKKMQLEVVKAIRSGDERLQEDDIYERLPRYVAEHPEQCVGFDAPRWAARWKKLTDLFINELKTKGPYVPTSSLEDEELELIEQDQDSFGPGSSQILAPEDDKPKEVQRVKKYVIVYSRNRRFARLHSTSTNCPWSKAEVFDSSEVDTALPDQYDARCKICWPTRVGDPAEESDCWESDESADDI